MKKFIIVALLVCCAALGFAQEAVYKIGDRGPAGGWVFFDKGRFSDGWRYLEAASAETEMSAQWSGYGKGVPGTETGVGSGSRNTRIIVEELYEDDLYRREKGESVSAALMCAMLNFGGYADWFLPSKDELNLMYQNLKKKGLGDFGDGYYWSSSQIDTGYSSNQSFTDGRQWGSGQKYKGPVRAIRAF